MPDGVLLIPILKLICLNKIFCLWGSRENGNNHELSCLFFQYFFFQIIVLWSLLCSLLSCWHSGLGILCPRGTGLIPGIASLFGFHQLSIHHASLHLK